MTGTFRFVVSNPHERIDRLVADATGCGRRRVRQWLLEGRVRVNGHVASAAEHAAAGSEIVVQSEPEPQHPAGALLPIVFESASIVVVAKPAGLHSVRGRSAGSVAALLTERYPGMEDAADDRDEAGLVHRLDRDTSGVLVAARTREQYLRLRRAFRTGRTLKHYLALATGRLRSTQEVTLALARRRARMTVAGPHDDALEAETLLEPLDGGEAAGGWTLVKATMRTGVMHQIRAHMAAAGHPLFGDGLYGGIELEGSLREGQLLHALRFEAEGEIDVTVGPPADFVAAYAQLRRCG